MFSVLQVCFWIKEALGQVFFSLEKACILNLSGQGFLLLWFCFCPKATLENVVPVGVFLVWSSTGQGVKLRRSQVERARSLQDEKNWRTAAEIVWEFRTTDTKVSSFEHMRLCEWEGVRGWRWENLQMGRGQNFILKENERVRPGGRIESVLSRIHIERWLPAKIFYIFKKNPKEKQSNQANDTRIHTFPRMPLEFLLRDISIFETSMPRLPRQELRRHDIKILVPTLPQEISSHGENWTCISFTC